MLSVDLHCHSFYSDGALSIPELIALAAERSVSVLALTDHDSVAGVAEAQALAQQANIQLIPAVEISSVWQAQSIHIVGLGIDINDPLLKQRLQQQANARGVRAQAIAERLTALAKPGSLEAVLLLADGDLNRVSRNHFAQWLLAEGHIRNLQAAFDKYLGKGKPADVPMPWPTMEDAINWIKEAKGVAVLAHPGRYPLSRTKMRSLIQCFKEAGGQAMEVATTTEKPDMIRYLGVLSQQFGLEASQGSDFHGPHMPWLKLGIVPKLPEICTPVWQRWVS